MKNQYNNLFSPITIGTMKLKNRIVLAPMSVHITPPDGFFIKEKRKVVRDLLSLAQFSFVLMEILEVKYL